MASLRSGAMTSSERSQSQLLRAHPPSRNSLHEVLEEAFFEALRFSSFFVLGFSLVSFTMLAVQGMTPLDVARGSQRGLRIVSSRLPDFFTRAASSPPSESQSIPLPLTQALRLHLLQDRLARSVRLAFQPELSMEDVVLSIAEAKCSRSGCWAPDRTVIVTQVSSTYLDLLENWYTSVDGLGYARKVLFIAEDRRAYKHLKSKHPLQTLNLQHLCREDLPPKAFAVQRGRASSFSAIVSCRPFYLSALLALNVSILYNDVDMVWLRDPFPFFSRTAEQRRNHREKKSEGIHEVYEVSLQWEDSKNLPDMWVAEDGRVLDSAPQRIPRARVALPKLTAGSAHQMCTCFMMVRPTEGSRALVSRWAAAVKQEVIRLGRAVPNQVLWNKVFLEHAAEEAARQPVLKQGRGVPRGSLGEDVPGAHHEGLSIPKTDHASTGTVQSASVKWHREATSFPVAVLPVMQFPSGCLFFGGTYEWCKHQRQLYLQALEAGEGPTVVVHNNWIPGHDTRVRRFQDTGMWFASTAPELTFGNG